MPMCQFCARPGEFQCAWWLLDRVVNLWPSAVKPGMIAAARMSDNRATTIRPEIVGVEFCPVSYSDPGDEHYVVRLKWKDHEYSWIRSAGNPVQIYEPAPCGFRICFAHAREVDDERHYCADHWDAWQGDKTREKEPDLDLSAQRAIDAQLTSGVNRRSKRVGGSELQAPGERLRGAVLSRREPLHT